jgi:hypothetical protein
MSAKKSTPIQQSPDAEKAVLSCLVLSHREVFQLCAHANMDASWFNIPAHRTLWEVLSDLIITGKPADFISIAQRLRDTGKLESVGGGAAVNELFTFATAANAGYYVGILQDKKQRRDLIAAAEKILRRCEDGPADAVELTTEARNAFTELLARASGKRVGDFSTALLSAPELTAKEVPKRPALLGQWMREGDLGFIFAARGVGKTWMSLLIGSALSENLALGKWEAGERPRKVLYVDGEMSLADTQARAKSIRITSENFRWLHHEHLFDSQEITLNIAAPECQRRISALLQPGDVLVLDNLSCLCRGVVENDNDAWEVLLPWFLSQRRRKVTVIVIHHAGRNGEMRGASRREDAADWVLRLRDGTEDEGHEKAILSMFTKCRGCAPEAAMPLRWRIQIRDGLLAYVCESHSGPDALAALVLSGVEECSECAELLDVPKGTVSKWAKKLHKAGTIRIEGRKYRPPADNKQGSE